MGLVEECDALARAFSGLGVNEKSIIEIAQKWNSEHTSSFRKTSPCFTEHHPHHFESWHSHWVNFIQRESARFKEAVVLWAMHPWERDARLAKEALSSKNYGVLIEIACTRSSEELLGARRAYHSLFHLSIEEDVAFADVSTSYRNLLVPLVSSYRYEGPRVNEEIAKSEAKVLGKVIRHGDRKAIENNEELVRIIATRSKSHLKLIFHHYKEIFGKTIDEDLEHELSLKDAILCLCSPQTYFSKVLEMGLVDGGDEYAKEALIRVIVTRVHSDMKEIKEEYLKKYGVPLSHKIKEKTHGNFRDFLLSLVEKAN